MKKIFCSLSNMTTLLIFSTPLKQSDTLFLDCSIVLMVTSTHTFRKSKDFQKVRLVLLCYKFLMDSIIFMLIISYLEILNFKTFFLMLVDVLRSLILDYLSLKLMKIKLLTPTVVALSTWLLKC